MSQQAAAALLESLTSRGVIASRPFTARDANNLNTRAQELAKLHDTVPAALVRLAHVGHEEPSWALGPIELHRDQDSHPSWGEAGVYGTALPHNARRVCFLNEKWPFVKLPDTEEVRIFGPEGKLGLTALGLHIGHGYDSTHIDAELGIFLTPNKPPGSAGAVNVVTVRIASDGSLTTSYSERWAHKHAVVASMVGAKVYSPYVTLESGWTHDINTGIEDAYNLLANQLPLLPAYLDQLAEAMRSSSRNA